MNIGIDIDDTIMDTYEHLRPYVAEFYSRDIDYLMENNISYSTLPDEWKADEPAFGKKYFDHVVPDTPIKKDAVETIKRIKALGHQIFIITARDNTIYTDAYQTTTAQLEKHGVVYDKLICDMDKAKVCREEQIDLLIDDSLSHCEKVMAIGVECILFNSTGNLDKAINCQRVNNWQEVYSLIKAKQ